MPDEVVTTPTEEPVALPKIEQVRRETFFNGVLLCERATAKICDYATAQGLLSADTLAGDVVYCLTGGLAALLGAGSYGEDLTFDASVRRSEGNVAEISCTVVRDVVKLEFWAVTYRELAKDIKNWGADQGNDAPNLALVGKWQELPGRNDYSHYADYEFMDTDGQYYSLDNTGKGGNANTLILAQMIYQGITSYSVFAPVATRTSTWLAIPDDIGEMLGKQLEAADMGVRQGWATFAGTSANILALAQRWLCTMDRLTPNGNGTFTRVEEFTGADSWNENLYPMAGDGGEEAVE